MERFFNTAGPQKPELNYTIPSCQRIDWEELLHLVAAQRYFLLHAPRQTGKTTALLELMEALNGSGNYQALYVNIETSQTARNDAELGDRQFCDSFLQSARYYLPDRMDESAYRRLVAEGEPQQRFKTVLSYWATTVEQPTVLLLDEVDALVGDTLISLLRQLRAGYTQRPNAFPQSIILCGVRDIKDYRIHQGNGEVITGGSAFNIKTESLRLGNFSRQEVEQLYLQHTAETGQRFAAELFEPLWLDTAGQPWLVNALAHEMCWKDRSLRDRTQPITLAHYLAARERLIQSRATHLDQLADKLKEPRVHRVIAPILVGEEGSETIQPDDLSYVADLGLIRQERGGTVVIGNRIYQEIIPRELSWGAQLTISNQEQSWYLTPANRLDMVKLLTAFQHFFREHSESWLERFDYQEAGPQLLMQAFLQRIINGGGRINREYALGRRRTDLIIEWPVSEAGFWGEVQRIVVELKLLRGSLERLLPEALLQISDYADKAAAAEAHLVIFNRASSVSWDEKIWHQRHNASGRVVEVWGS
ncbi:ATP-binding protein [Ectothiorhodospiraceae bacterium BW-2]|nr:ATP-binding protein [Ectothiorhodospiraceae bacterium BW-2]